MEKKLRFSYIIIACIAFLSSITIRVTAQTVYVSPTGSASGDCTSGVPCNLDRAKAVIDTRNDNMTQDLIVSLAGGQYDLSGNGFVLDSTHSGSNGYYVTLRASDTNNPPVFFGGVSVGSSAWTSQGNGIFKTNVGAQRFRQIYVNGKQAIRARTPNRTSEMDGSGYNTVLSKNTANKTVAITASQIQNWDRMSNVEMVIFDIWYICRAKIDTFTVTSGQANVLFQEPGATAYFNNIANKGWTGKAPYFFENALEFLDSENEWYLDETNGDLYYKPVGGSMTGQDVVLPMQETLVSFVGSPTGNIHHIRLENIKLQYSNWTLPSLYGITATQGMQILNSFPAGYDKNAGGLEIQYAHDLDITGNTLEGMGSSGIVIAKGGQNLRIRQNILSGMNASGIRTDVAGTKNPTDVNVSKNILIAGNLVQNYGIDYQNGMGIFSSFVRGMVIEHNHIKDGRYSAMQTGNQTGDDIEVGMNSNQIRYNRIENVMRLMADGGGIYQLGMQKNSNIYENYVAGLTTKNNWLKNNAFNGHYPCPLYLDNYSAYWTVERNMLDMSEVIFQQNLVGSGLAHDNTLVNGGKTTDANIAYRAGLNNLEELTTNVAAGKTATASSSWSAGLAPGKAVDGSISTLFSTASGSSNGWWQVDLGEGYKISRIEIVARIDMDQSYFRQDYTIKGSNSSDGSNAVVLAESGSAVWADRGTWIASSRSTQSYRYVRIEKSTMNFAEVRVFGVKASTAYTHPNVALNKTATALNTYNSSTVAPRGNDDNDSTLFASLSATTGSPQPWWQVDLGAAYTISRVQILPRNDLDQANVRRNFEIQASNSSSFTTYTVLASQSTVAFQAGELWDKPVTDGNAYRYFRVAKTIVESLNFAEFRLFGTASGSARLQAPGSERTAELSEVQEIIYPNPTTSGNPVFLNLSGGSTALEGSTMQIINAAGLVVGQQKLSAGDRLKVETKGLNPGSYLVRFRSGGTSVTKRLIVNH